MQEDAVFASIWKALREGNGTGVEDALETLRTVGRLDYYESLLDGVHWKPATQQGKTPRLLRTEDIDIDISVDEDHASIFLFPVGELVCRHETSFGAAVQRLGLARWIALVLICDSPGHDALKAQITALHLERIDCRRLRAPRLERLPNLEVLHAYFDEAPLTPLSLRYPALKQLSLFGEGVQNLEGLEHAPLLERLDVRAGICSFEPVRGMKHLKDVFHFGSDALDANALAETSVATVSLACKTLHAPELLKAPHLKRLSLRAQGTVDLCVEAACSPVEVLKVEEVATLALPTLARLHVLIIHGDSFKPVHVALAPQPSLRQLFVFTLKNPLPPLRTHFPALEKINLFLKDDASPFQNVDFLEGAPRLWSIRMRGKATDLQALHHLPALQTLFWADATLPPLPGVEGTERRVHPYGHTSKRLTPRQREVAQLLERAIYRAGSSESAGVAEILDKLKQPRVLEGALSQLAHDNASGETHFIGDAYLEGNPHRDSNSRDDIPDLPLACRKALARRVLLVAPDLPAARTLREATTLRSLGNLATTWKDGWADLSFLHAFPRLTQAFARGTRIFGLHHVRLATALKKLGLYGPIGAHIETCLGSLPALETFLLAQNRTDLQSLTGIESWSSLRTLRLRLPTLPPLQPLHALKLDALELRQTTGEPVFSALDGLQVQKLIVDTGTFGLLARLPMLRAFRGGREWERFSGLAHPSLKELGCDAQHMREVGDLSGLPALTTLELRSFEPVDLCGLPALETLSLYAGAAARLETLPDVPIQHLYLDPRVDADVLRRLKERPLIQNIDTPAWSMRLTIQ